MCCSCRAHNAVYFCADVTDWKAQEDIYVLAEKTFGKTIDIVIMVAGILDSSNLINDSEQGNF
jgi:NAD(P)-dependent dehydrogenase (short-subunit alcohol dehydrogenase family)